MYYKSIERLTAVMYPRGPHLLHPTACKLYCWKPLAKRTSKTEIQSHPSKKKKKKAKIYIYIYMYVRYR